MCLAIPVRIVALTTPGMAKVTLGGIVKEISVLLIDDPRPGEYVMLHVGFALSRIDEAEAHRTLALLAALDPAVTADVAGPQPADAAGAPPPGHLGLPPPEDLAPPPSPGHGAARPGEAPS